MTSYKTQEFCILGNAMNAGSMKLGEDKAKVESIDQPVQVETGLLVWAGKKKVCRIELVD